MRRGPGLTLTETPRRVLTGLIHYPWTLLVALVVCSALPIQAGSHTVGDVQDLTHRISELRVQARYDEAATSAQDLVKLIRSQPGFTRQEVEDTEWLVESLRHAATLPEATQRRLARADSLEQYLEANVAYNEAGGGPLAETWLGLVEGALGSRWPEIFRAHTLVGGYHYFDGDYISSERHFREALRLAREHLGDDHPRIAGCISDLSVPVLLQGNLSEAEVLLREALERLQRLGGNSSALEAMNNLAAVLERQGDDLGAEALARAAIETYSVLTLERLGHPEANPGHLNRLARILRRNGELSAAEAEVRRAIKVYETGQNQKIAFDLGVSYLVLGNVLADRGDLTGALDAHKRSLDICRQMKGEGHADVANHLMSLAETRLKRGERDEAQRLLREALAINRRTLGSLHPQTCENLLRLGRALEAPGTLAEAEAVLTEASAAFDAVRLRGPVERRAVLPLASPYTDLALVRLAAGRSSEAWSAAEQALARSLADLLLASDRRSLDPADAARQDSLARVLTDLERAVEALPPPASPAGLNRNRTASEEEQRAESLRLQLLRAQADWAALQEKTRRMTIPNDGDDENGDGNDVVRTEGSADRYATPRTDSYPLKRIQATIGKHAAIVGWIDPQEHSALTDRWGYVLRASGPPRWVRLPASTGAGADLRALIDEAASWPVRVPLSEDAIRGAREVWDEYLAPLLVHLTGVDDLYAIASGSTLGIPLEAALDPDGRWATDTFTLSYVPSGTVHAWLQERETLPPEVKGPGGAALLVGDPPFVRDVVARAGPHLMAEMPRPASIPVERVWRSAVAGNEQALDELPPLPGSRDEISGLKRSLTRSMVLVGSDACEQTLADLAATGKLQEFRFLHFATHAIVDDRAPERSALVLSRVGLPDPVQAAMSGGRAYDGLLRAVEITREWRLHAELVALSGCRTGLGKEAPGEGYLGLAHAFLQVGARSLLVSLWAVDDRASSLLMDRFYENLTGSNTGEGGGRHQAPMGKAEALREAKRWLRDFRNPDGARPYEHPVYWAPFVLIGDPD